MTELRNYKVSSLTFENKVQNGTQLKLKNHFSYNVNYFEEDKRCVAKLDYRVEEENLLPFSIRVEMEALFTYEEGDDRADIHTESFSQLFPFVRQIIHTATAISGVPGLMIPMTRIEKSNVKIADRPETPEKSPLN
jgi:preprotein translocase subunit SecB